MTKTYRSEALAAIHETASDLHDVGLLDKQTMRPFDALALAPVAPERSDAIPT